MSVADDIAEAFSGLASVFGKTATIQGQANVPVTSGPNLNRSLDYGDGGTNAIQAVTLWYLLSAGPAPVIDGDIEFKGLKFAVQSFTQHSATWEVVATQVLGSA